MKQLILSAFLSISALAQTPIVNTVPSAKISWIAPKAVPGLKFGSLTYTLSLGTESGKYSQNFSTTAVSKVLDNLQFNTVYYAAIKATNEYGLESDYGQEVVFKITQPRKYIIVLTSKDKGKTWQEIGEVIVPLPIVTGQKYKTKTVTK